MPFTDLSSTQVQRLVELVKERESIQAKLDEIHRSIEELGTGTKAHESPVRSKPKKARRGGKLKDRLLKTLQTAGEKGLAVKELAAQLKAKPASVAVWFYTTGKKVKGLRKIGPARYAYRPA
jgi:uncharacterized coiled-coil DUF342 family protein